MSSDEEIEDEVIDSETHEKVSTRGPLAWFARNSVAANVLMIILVVGGLVNLKSSKQEVFPGFQLDFVQAYRKDIMQNKQT